MSQPIFYHDLTAFIKERENEQHLIAEERKKELAEFAETIKPHLSKKKKDVRVIFVCTHNSRRSQLAEIWLRTAAAYYGIEGFETFSGGTEATAFNPRMVSAIQRAGFAVEKRDSSANPKYVVHTGESDVNQRVLFSKKFSDGYNPQSGFIAVMVCTQADEACPVVPGAAKRISLPYRDPKEFDNTENEERAYDDKVREIGREMLYMAEVFKR